MRSAGESCAHAAAAPSSSALLFNAEAVQSAIERPNINTAVGDGNSAPMIPRSDLIAAGPQLFSGICIERVQRRVSRTGDAAFGRVFQTGVGIGLIRILAAAISKDDA